MDISHLGLLELINDNNHQNKLCVTRMDIIYHKLKKNKLDNVCQITGIPYESFINVGNYIYKKAINAQEKVVNLNKFIIDDYFH